MRKSTPLTVTLPPEMVAMVREKVASGEYASDSEVIRDGLRAMQARDAAIERWLETEVARSYEKHIADPSKAYPAEELMERVRASYRARTKET